MRNFSFNNQYLVSIELKTSKKERSKHRNYKILSFKDGDTSRTIQLYHFGEEKIVDTNGDDLSRHVPYILTGFVNNSGNNIFLNLEKAKKDLKSLKKSWLFVVNLLYSSWLTKQNLWWESRRRDSQPPCGRRLKWQKKEKNWQEKKW